jgi:hypothetical protein
LETQSPAAQPLLRSFSRVGDPALQFAHVCQHPNEWGVELDALEHTTPNSVGDLAEITIEVSGGGGEQCSCGRCARDQSHADQGWHREH